MLDMKRKFLFIVFTSDDCKRNHALLYALDLHKKGYETKLILEGDATQALTQLNEATSTFAKLLVQAQQAGVLAGTCQTASGGCKCEGTSEALKAAQANNIALLHDMDGHPGIEPFLREGYEVLIF